MSARRGALSPLRALFVCAAETNEEIDMATFAELTQEERDVFQNWERQLRASQGALQRTLNTLESIKITYTGQIAAILSQLDANTVVPNSSGLAGSIALDITDDLAPLVTDLSALLHATTGYNTDVKQERREKACGLNNTLGNE